MTLKFLHKRSLVSVFCGLKLLFEKNFHKLIKPVFIEYQLRVQALGNQKINLYP